GGVVSPDEAVALSFAVLSDVPRAGLTDRLRADDPHLLERARALLPQAEAVRAAAAGRGIRTVAWNEPAFPAALLTLGDLPPALWFRGDRDRWFARRVSRGHRDGDTNRQRSRLAGHHRRERPGARGRFRGTSWRAR